MSSFFGQVVCNIRTPFAKHFPTNPCFFFATFVPGFCEDLSTGLLLEHMPQLYRRAFVGVDFLSASTWVKCVKIMQGPMPQAGGWLGQGKMGEIFSGFPAVTKKAGFICKW